MNNSLRREQDWNITLRRMLQNELDEQQKIESGFEKEW